MNVAEVMTPDVATVRPDTPLVDAIDLMVERGISGLPVVDGIGAPIGVLTEGDLLRRIELGTDMDHAGLLEVAGNAADYVRSRGRRVRDVMTQSPITIPETAPISLVVKLMREHQIRRLLVVCDGVLAGIVTRADLVRAIGRLLRQEAGQDGTDRALEARIREELALQSWLPDRLSVVVHDGVAEITGVLSDVKQREGVRVLCENTSGVSAVKLALSPTSHAIPPR